MKPKNENTQNQSAHPLPDNLSHYTADKNAQIVLALLKAHNIRKIIVSPGTTNITIARSAQNDSFFTLYSAIDERSAAYRRADLVKRVAKR